jgi:hypothetical protein
MSDRFICSLCEQDVVEERMVYPCRICSNCLLQLTRFFKGEPTNERELMRQEAEIDEFEEMADQAEKAQRQRKARRSDRGRIIFGHRNIEGRCNLCNSILGKNQFICLDCVKDKCPHCGGNKMEPREDRDDIHGHRTWYQCADCHKRVFTDM